MSGALAERAFATKIEKAGFREVAVRDRSPFALEDAALYPLFTPDLIELMQTRLSPEVQSAVATSVVVTAVKRNG